jgi:hypothetical protein
MEDLSHPQERRKHQRYLIDLPLNFQMTETSDIHPGLSINASETGLLIQTFKDMPIGIRLKIELLFAKDFELSNLQGMAQIIWKDHYVWSDYKGYKYGLQFVQISNENYKKLKLLLENLFNLEDTSLYQPA